MHEHEGDERDPKADDNEPHQTPQQDRRHAKPQS
jgi:hypothetical protein